MFPNDHWEEAAKTCLSEECKKFTSTKVENEFHKKTEATLRIIQKEMLGFIRSNNQRKPEESVRESDFQRFERVIKNLKISSVLIPLIEEMKENETSFNLLHEAMRDILREFLREVQTRKDEIQARIDEMDIESWSRFEVYKEIETALLSIIDNYDDVQILLDAHDLRHTIQTNIDFITGDWKDIKSNEESIITVTEIDKITYLAEFAS